MMVAMKKCLRRLCTVQFPAHYFHDYCPKHSTSEDERNAEKRSGDIFGRFGATGLAVNALSSFLPDEEALGVRRLLRTAAKKSK